MSVKQRFCETPPPNAQATSRRPTMLQTQPHMLASARPVSWRPVAATIVSNHAALSGVSRNGTTLRRTTRSNGRGAALARAHSIGDQRRRYRSVSGGPNTAFNRGFQVCAVGCLVRLQIGSARKGSTAGVREWRHTHKKPVTRHRRPSARGRTARCASQREMSRWRSRAEYEYR